MPPLRHGQSAGMRRRATPEYRAWGAMIQRCTNEREPSFRNYGARGIRVCDRWRSFDNFIADMGARPSGSHSLDRIDVNGDYEPRNCRWATARQQKQNTRQARYVTAFGATMSITEWSRAHGVDRGTITSRLRLGWSAERAVMPLFTEGDISCLG